MPPQSDERSCGRETDHNGSRWRREVDGVGVTGAEGRTTETDESRTDRQTAGRTDKEAQMHCESEAGVAKYRGRVNAHHFAAFLITAADTCWQLCNIH